MADVKKFLAITGNFLRFILVLAFFYNVIIENICKNKITHVYVSALTLAVAIGSSLNPRPGGLGFKQHPRATANVNA